ncbi:MAG: zinc-dependent metalloprotease, partial [Balneolaceae bacterium]|nr:zinc-dependent metalloprotease [Balneolaceae bacterium]
HAVPVDSLRSPAYTSRHGTSASIMDYARFNYIAQPEDGVTQFLPQMGEYDKWAIKWGYTWFGDMPAEEKEKILHEWTVERANDPKYFYGRQGNSADPRSQSEALGDNNMEAGRLGLANLAKITKNMTDWIQVKGEGFYDLDELYSQILLQWRRYMRHVVKNVGGVFETPKTYDQEGVVYESVPAHQQREAMAFLAEHAFADPPEWMLNAEILDRINQDGVVEDIRQRQVSVLNSLTDPGRIARLIEYDHRGQKSYSPNEFMDDLRGAIWTELDEDVEISVYRRNLQRSWVKRLEYLMTEDIQVSFWAGPIHIGQSDMRSMAREQLKTVYAEVRQSVTSARDRSTKAHLNDIKSQIELILNPD